MLPSLLKVLQSLVCIAGFVGCIPVGLCAVVFPIKLLP